MNVVNNMVLVLNRNWQAIDTVPVWKAFGMMAAPSKFDARVNVATAVELTDDSSMPYRPVEWEEWLTLPIRSQDATIHTARLEIRVPTIVVLAHYRSIPMVMPKLTTAEVARRDEYKDIYTGEYVSLADGNVDHLTPKSRGGRKKDWRNVGWTKRTRNSAKGNRYNHEVGLKLRKLPKAPGKRPKLDIEKIKNPHPDWMHFLKASQLLMPGVKVALSS
jgi:5-methylcytosine-specific restriction endonuclease McrA